MITSFRELLLDRLENYSKYSSFDKKYINLKPYRGVGLRIKQFDDGIKIKVKTNLFLLITDSMDVYIQDSVRKDIRYPKMLVRRFNSIHRLLTYLETVFNNPSLIFKELDKINDPLIVGKFKFGNQLLRDDEGNVITALRQSDFEEIVSESIEIGGSNFRFNLSATIDNSIQPKIRAKRRG